MTWVKGQKAYHRKKIPARNYLKEEVQARIKNIESNFLENIIDVFYEKTKDIENYHDKNIYSVKGFVPFISTEILKINQYNNKPHQLEYWTIRGWSEIEAEKRRLKRTKEWYITKYGLEIGTEKWNKLKENIKKGTLNTLEKYIEKYGEVEGCKKWEKLRLNNGYSINRIKTIEENRTTLKNEKRFYIYVLVNPKIKYNKTINGIYMKFEPFYVGKGRGGRCNTHFTRLNRNKTKNTHKNNKIISLLNEGFTKIQILIKAKENLTEKEAYELEKILILKIGRRDFKTGPLTNKTEGGGGINNYKHG